MSWRPVPNSRLPGIRRLIPGRPMTCALPWGTPSSRMAPPGFQAAECVDKRSRDRREVRSVPRHLHPRQLKLCRSGASHRKAKEPLPIATVATLTFRGSGATPGLADRCRVSDLAAFCQRQENGRLAVKRTVEQAQARETAAQIQVCRGACAARVRDADHRIRAQARQLCHRRPATRGVDARTIIPDITAILPGPP